MNKVSIKEVVAKILMRLPSPPTSQQMVKIKYFINEGLRLMQVTKSMEVGRTIFTLTEDKRLILPSDLVTLTAVYIGTNDNRLIRLAKAYNSAGIINRNQYQQSGNILTFGELDSVAERTEQDPTDPNKLVTTVEVGIEYLKYDLDEEGYFLIPDSATVHEALYWFVVRNLLGAGYTIAGIRFDFADQMWERVHAPRAIEEMKTFTPEDAEVLLRQSTKLIWNYNQWEGFHANSRERIYADLS